MQDELTRDCEKGLFAGGPKTADGPVVIAGSISFPIPWFTRSTQSKKVRDSELKSLGLLGYA
jgi:hypothetical protein